MNELIPTGRNWARLPDFLNFYHLF